MESNKLFLISDEYIEFLSKGNSHVMSNKPTERTYHRKYIGLLTKLGGFTYFVPMSSPKNKDFVPGTQNVRKDSLTTIYMKNKKNYFGSIRFNLMIPVPESEVTLYNINDEGDFKYKMLVLNELYFIRGAHEKIEKTAKNLYEKKLKQLKGSDENSNPLMTAVLDFKQLEELYQKWIELQE